jgi:hypothetical protein
MTDIVLINPRFDTSYWGLEHSLSFLGGKATMPPASLPLLAALTPSSHRVTLIDENVQEIDLDRCAKADIVGLTGMFVQRKRMREILVELKRRGKFTVVGGPWVTVQEDDFGDLVDVLFVGEAEESWPRFLTDWSMRRHQARYEQTERTDLTKLPLPRLDLLPIGDYRFGSIQITRGCPFLCEFCDIIVVFGRKPRIKSAKQVLAELEALLAAGKQTIFIVDDNMIGNKNAIKPILREMIAWQEARGYPLSFGTEASIDLAEDEELMRLMVDANITAVFVGIETPNEEALRETRKLQNLADRFKLIYYIRRAIFPINNSGLHQLRQCMVQNLLRDRRHGFQELPGKSSPDRRGELRHLLNRRHAVKPSHERIVERFLWARRDIVHFVQRSNERTPTSRRQKRRPMALGAISATRTRLS